VRLVLIKLVVRAAYQIFSDTQSPWTMKTLHIHCCDISVCTVAGLAAATAILANYTLSLLDLITDGFASICIGVCTTVLVCRSSIHRLF